MYLFVSNFQHVPSKKLGFLTWDVRAATLYNINAASMTTFNRDVPQKAEKV